MSEFDKFADDYNEINDQFSSFFGETTGYFATYKAQYVARFVGTSFGGSILDYGCGIGTVSGELHRLIPGAIIHGYDPSNASIEKAKTNQSKGGESEKSRLKFYSELSELNKQYDLIILANVLHHVAKREREELVNRLAKVIKHKGSLLIFEHNTLNFLVMHTLKKHPFDVDAVFLPFRESIALVKIAGLTAKINFIVFFPSFLRFLRFIEHCLWFLPIGGQYVCIGTKTSLDSEEVDASNRRLGRS